MLTAEEYHRRREECMNMVGGVEEVAKLDKEWEQALQTQSQAAAEFERISLMQKMADSIVHAVGAVEDNAFMDGFKNRDPNVVIPIAASAAEAAADMKYSKAKLDKLKEKIKEEVDSATKQVSAYLADKTAENYAEKNAKKFAPYHIQVVRWGSSWKYQITVDGGLITSESSWATPTEAQKAAEIRCEAEAIYAMKSRYPDKPKRAKSSTHVTGPAKKPCGRHGRQVLYNDNTEK